MHYCMVLMNAELGDCGLGMYGMLACGQIMWKGPKGSCDLYCPYRSALGPPHRGGGELQCRDSMLV